MTPKARQAQRVCVIKDNARTNAQLNASALARLSSRLNKSLSAPAASMRRDACGWTKVGERRWETPCEGSRRSERRWTVERGSACQTCDPSLRRQRASQPPEASITTGCGVGVRHLHVRQEMHTHRDWRATSVQEPEEHRERRRSSADEAEPDGLGCHCANCVHG